MNLRLACQFVLSLAILLVSVSLTMAEVRLPKIFGSGMCVQRDLPLPVWGWAEPGEKLTFRLADKRAEATADSEGRWKTRIPSLSAGGPHELVVEGSNTITIDDVLVGEIWICSGQSNMWFALNRTTNAKAEIEAAEHPKIRLFTVANNPQTTKQDDCRVPGNPVRQKRSMVFPRSLSTQSQVRRSQSHE